ncbi:TetR family transcriptional regulator [Nocardiopsis sediminis]|uniref:TetR family transcriptional regulator n=1 Tax=Nocardiopsis sediminis TaxID=1778267 RepID=A0ABV8FLF1_9ACTN
MAGPTSRRGRPPLADPGLMRERAIGILLRDGYPNVTMTRLATDLGVSLRTLHRYFPTKSDIVWGGTEGSLDALRRHLGAADPHATILEAITEAVIGVFSEDSDEPSLSQVRIRAIATTAEAGSSRPDTYAGWLDETAAFIARRTGRSAHEIGVRSAAAAIQAAISEALAIWAEDDGGESPAEAVAKALSGFGLLTAPADTGPIRTGG